MITTTTERRLWPDRDGNLDRPAWWIGCDLCGHRQETGPHPAPDRLPLDEFGRTARAWSGWVVRTCALHKPRHLCPRCALSLEPEAAPQGGTR